MARSQDRIRLKRDLRATILALGRCSWLEDKRRSEPLQDDISSTAFWYQAEPHAPFPELPGPDGLEVI